VTDFALLVQTAQVYVMGVGVNRAP